MCAGQNPKAKFYLCGNPRDLYEWDVIDEDGNVCEDGIDGTISYPVTKEKLLQLLNVRRAVILADRTAGTELDDSLLQQAAGGCNSEESHSQNKLFNTDKL